MRSYSLTSEIPQQQPPQVALLLLWIRSRSFKVADPKGDAEGCLVEEAGGFAVLFGGTGEADAAHAVGENGDEVALDFAEGFEHAEVGEVFDHDVFEALIADAEVDCDVDHFGEHGC